MKKLLFSMVFLVLAAAVPAIAGQGFPTSLAGFTLGQHMDECKSMCELDRAIPDSDAPFLSEALIKPDALPGVRGGSLSFGNCTGKDELIRIKLKFVDKGKGLFDRLVDRYNAKFGKPDTYVGDAFRNVVAWEWTFSDKKGGRVSLVLMWSRDSTVRPGVSIKMTDLTRMDAENQCYTAQLKKNGTAGESRIKSLNFYVPR